MAAPGEFVPQQFALGILQLAGNLKSRNAELAEMRSARARRNFLDKERLELQERGVAAQEQQNAFTQEAMKSEAEAKREAQAVAAGIQKKRIETADAELVQKAVGDLGSKGIAFLPGFAQGQVAEITKGITDPDGSDPVFHTTDLDGRGTIVTRIPPGQKQRFEKARLDNMETVGNIAKLQADRESADALKKLRLERAKEIRATSGAGLTPKYVGLVTSYRRLFDGRLKDLQKQLTVAQGLQSRANPKPEITKRIRDLTKRVTEAGLNPITLASADEREEFETLSELGRAHAAKDLEFVQRGEDPSQTPNDPLLDPAESLEELERIGPAFKKAALQHPVSLALDKRPEAPWEMLPSSFTSEKGGQFYSDLAQRGALIPLNAQAVKELGTPNKPGTNPRLQNMIHPQAATAGFGSGTTKAPAAAAPRAATQAQPAAADPKSPQNIDAAIEDLTSRVSAATTAEERTALIQQIDDLMQAAAQ